LILTPGGGRVARMALSERDQAILDFERTWWTEPGPKEVAIRVHFDLSPTRYYQVLHDLLETPEADAYDPLVVRRLRRLRDRRRRARYEGRSAGEPPSR
jgi:hypothetical protein